jgi:hypothetical protein
MEDNERTLREAPRVREDPSIVALEHRCRGHSICLVLQRQSSAFLLDACLEFPERPQRVLFPVVEARNYIGFRNLAIPIKFSRNPKRGKHRIEGHSEVECSEISFLYLVEQES